MKSQELSVEFANRIVIRPTRSRIVITLITSLHLAALSLLFLVAVDFWLLSILAGLIMLSLQRELILLKRCTYKLSLQLGGNSLLQINNHSWNEIELIESFVTQWLIVLRVRSLREAKRHSLVFARDSMNSTSFRHLRICIHHFNATY